MLFKTAHECAFGQKALLMCGKGLQFHVQATAKSHQAHGCALSGRAQLPDTSKEVSTKALFN